MLPVWLCILRLDHTNRPGVVARVTMAFADRGISLDEVLATGVGERPVIVLKFSASERLAEYFRRRFERMPMVTNVTIRRGEEARVWEAVEP
jgi:hypothetical protein